MSERYTRVFSLPNDLYTQGDPLIIKAGALLVDNYNGKVVAQLKFQNISLKKVKLVKVRISSFDAIGRAIDGITEYEYLDIDAKRDDEFGSKTPIYLSNENARAFSVKICEVGFSDGSVYSGAEHTQTALSPCQNIARVLTQNECVVAYKKRFGENMDYAIYEHADIWRCSCGAVNNKCEEKCHICKNVLSDMKNVDRDELYRYGIYCKADGLSKLSDISALQKALELFEKVKGYKDADEKVNGINEKIKALKEAAAEAEKKAEKKAAIFRIVLAVLLVLIVVSAFAVSVYKKSPAGTFRYHGENGGICIDGLQNEDLTEIVIPDEMFGKPVTSIGNSAFRDCSSLTSATIGNSVTSIGSYAFYNCSKLTSITIPDSVTSIGEFAFRGCSGLTSITIPDGVIGINKGAFYGCSGLTSITIPDGVTSIDELVFFGCSSLEKITIPDGVTNIGKDAFGDCSGLTSIRIPDSVTSIGEFAFCNCSSLVSITLPFVGETKNGTSNTCFGYIFGASTYSDNSKYVPSSLKYVVITGETSIGDYAFYGCRSLTNIRIPDSVTSIGNDAFYGCSSLTGIGFKGTKEQWGNVSLDSGWKSLSAISQIICTDGTIYFL